MVAVAVGNALEVYDFLAYAVFAAQIGRTFFPAHSETTSLLASLATFGAGFLARPLGAVVIGRYGDRAGRRPAMLLSFSLMGGAMLAFAVMPPHSVIGPAATVLVIFLRLVQGFAFGGEFGPSTAFLLETPPPGRRGLCISLQYLSQDVAILTAGLVGLALAQALSPAALESWGWRVAFLLGALIVPYGLILRRRLSEPLADAQGGRGPSGGRRTAALSLVLLAAGAVATYVGTYMTTYATRTLGFSLNTGFLATAAVGLAGMVLGPVGGWLSDHFGRKPVMIVPVVVLAVASSPAFWLVSRSGSGALLLWLSAWIAGCTALFLAAALASIAETLPPQHRSGRLGLLYALAVSVFGGSTQFVLAWLTAATGSALAPAACLTAAMLLAAAAIAALPETAPGGRRGAALLSASARS
ncbi:MFS transporter [Phenylobacterium sp. LjRoot225]|uniref:MFS transporter n=1 Tax=Phenylobacterium sp. LjRoot225 TaxID=3342285 RepID=UPI003ECF5586